MKIKVNSVGATTSKTNKSYQVVNYDNNEEASAWDNNKGNDFFPFIGKEVEVEITVNGKYKNIKLASIASASKETPKEPAKNNELDLRKSALLLATELIKVTGKTATNENIREEALWVEHMLRNGFEKSPA